MRGPAFLATCLLAATACGPGVRLTGDRDGDGGTTADALDDVAVETDRAGEDASDEEPPPDVVVDPGLPDLDFAAEDVADVEEAADFVVPPCPVWAVPVDTGDLEDGTEAHPFVGLQRAIERRGTCDTVFLRGGTTDTPFDAAVDITLEEGELLAIVGYPADAARAEMDAHGDIGLFATGAGMLFLRHLAVRHGHADVGGCLNAQVAQLLLEDTEWSDCRAATEAGAVWVWAEVVSVRQSIFVDNATDRGREDGNVGGMIIDGPRDTAEIDVEGCRFERNVGRFGGALLVRALTEFCVVRDSVFAGNEAEWWGAAVEIQAGQIFHNLFQANGPSYEAPAVQVTGTPGTWVFNNLFRENRGGRGPTALTVAWGVVKNNLFVRNVCINAPGSGWCTAAVWARDGGPDVRNNTFVDNESENGVAHLSFDTVFGHGRSNLFAGGAGRAAIGTDYPEWGESAAQEYNAVWDVPDPAWGEGLRLGEGNLEADPLFYGADDFHLGAGSACVDAGDPDPVLRDWDGTRNDVGAFGGPEGYWTALREGDVP